MSASKLCLQVRHDGWGHVTSRSMKKDCFKTGRKAVSKIVHPRSTSNPRRTSSTRGSTIMEEKEIDAHNVTVEELCKRFNTSIEAGLTDTQVAEAMEEHDDDDRYHRHHHYRNHHILIIIRCLRPWRSGVRTS